MQNQQIIKKYTIEQIFDKMVEKNIDKCVMCGNELFLNDSDHYEHKEGGIYLFGFEEKQWVHFECSKCKYGNSLVKLFSKIVPIN